MQSLLNKILIVILLLLAGTVWYYQRRAELNYREYANTLAVNGILKLERDGIYSKLLVVRDQVESLQQDSAYKRLRIRELLDIIKKKDARITGLVAFQASWKTDSVRVSGRAAEWQRHTGDGNDKGEGRTRGSTPTEMTEKCIRVEFGAIIQGDSVYGYTLTSPPEAVVGMRRRPISFAVAMVENKNGMYETILTSDNPYIEIAAADGQIIPYEHKRGFLRRMIGGPMVSIGWSYDRGVAARARASIWKIEPYLEFHEKGLDYGGQINVWEYKW